jgi:membrane protease subunit (stomatin/prohibitin family)
VYPNNALADNLLKTAMTNDPRNPAVVSLNTGNIKTVANFVTTLTTQINLKGTAGTNTSDVNQTLAQQNQKAELREVLINQLKDMPISDISSIKLFSTALSSTTQDTKEISRAAAVSYNLYFV